MLYLIRHAEARNSAPDDLRPLTPLGHAQVGRLAGFLRGAGAFRPAEVWHSPLVRARETAAGLHRELGLKVPLREVPGLRPEDDPEVLQADLGGLRTSLALVSHEPFLSSLASLLVTGSAEPPRFLMKKTGVLALEPAGRFWVVCWHLDPDLLP